MISTVVFGWGTSVGQGGVLHVSWTDSVPMMMGYLLPNILVEPVQPVPPCSGSGLLHVRERMSLPVLPHAVTEQGPVVHEPQPPSIGQGDVAAQLVVVLGFVPHSEP